MRTVTIANQKGGCGKTTVAINLSASLAREGRRVLLVDLDPQAHCALGMAVPEEQIDLSILDCLLKRCEGEPLELSRITWQIAPNLDLAPSRSHLATLEPKLDNHENAEVLLRDLLEANAGRYDYCIVDSPPHMGLLMRNALRAADVVIIPIDTGYFSLYGLTQQLATIEQLGERNGGKPSVRVLANQYDVRTKLAREILAELRKRFKSVVYDTIVNFNTKLKEGASFGQPITEFAPASMGARDFQKLARELVVGEPSMVPSPEILQHVDRLAADAERLLATTTTLVNAKATPTSEPTLIGSAPVTPPEHIPAAVGPAADDEGRRVPSRASGTPARPASGAAPAGRALPAINGTRRAEPDLQPGSVQLPTQGPSRTLAQPVARARPPEAAAPPPPAGTDAQITPRTAPRLSASAPPLTRSTPPGTKLKATAPGESASSAEIDRKIEAIYGVRQDGDTVIFRNRNPEASEIQLAGDFNDWMPHTTPMRRLPDGDFEARMRLPKGRYRYRLVIDGRWSHDQNNPAIEANEYGELNSVVIIKQ